MYKYSSSFNALGHASGLGYVGGYTPDALQPEEAIKAHDGLQWYALPLMHSPARLHVRASILCTF